MGLGCRTLAGAVVGVAFGVSIDDRWYLLAEYVSRDKYVKRQVRGQETSLHRGGNARWVCRFCAVLADHGAARTTHVFGDEGRSGSRFRGAGFLRRGSASPSYVRPPRSRATRSNSAQPYGLPSHHGRPLRYSETTGQPESEVVTANLDGTELWGEVESVVHIELSVMLQLAKYAAANAACNDPAGAGRM